MPGVWKEQYFDRNINETASGVNPTRGWTVTGVGPDAARTDPLAPRRGDAHPDNSFLVINSVLYSPTGYGTSVRAQYVPVEFLDPTPPEDKTGLDWSEIDTDHEDEDVDVPVFERVTKQFPGAAGAVVEKMVWKRKENTVPFRKTVVVHRIPVIATVVSDGSVFTQFTISDLVKAQHNKIHTINGRRMLFRAGGTKRLAKDKYRFNYEWVEDPGIDYTLGVDIGGEPGFAMIGSMAIPVASVTHVIPPFSRVDTSTSGTDPEALPTIHVSLAYKEEPNGHLTLPGVG